MADSPIISVLAEHRRKYFKAPEEKSCLKSEGECPQSAKMNIIECESIEELDSVLEQFMGVR